jgi:hypothetical protein
VRSRICDRTSWSSPVPLLRSWLLVLDQRLCELPRVLERVLPELGCTVRLYSVCNRYVRRKHQATGVQGVPCWNCRQHHRTERLHPMRGGLLPESAPPRPLCAVCPWSGHGQGRHRWMPPLPARTILRVPRVHQLHCLRCGQVSEPIRSVAVRRLPSWLCHGCSWLVQLHPVSSGSACERERPVRVPVLCTRKVPGRFRRSVVRCL